MSGTMRVAVNAGAVSVARSIAAAARCAPLLVITHRSLDDLACELGGADLVHPTEGLDAGEGRRLDRGPPRRVRAGVRRCDADLGGPVYVTLREGEPFEELYRRFKRGMEASGILREYRRKQRFTPAHEERRAKIKAANRKRARARGRGRGGA